MDMESIEDLLKKAIEDKGITRYELSLRSGVPQPTIARIVKGVTKDPRMDTLEKLAEALDVDKKELAKYTIKETSPDYSDDPILSKFDGVDSLSAEAAGLIRYLIAVDIEDMITRKQLAAILELVKSFTQRDYINM